MRVSVSFLTDTSDYFLRYRRKVELYNGRVEELNTVTQERDDVKKQYDELRKRRQTYSELFIIFFSPKLIST